MDFFCLTLSWFLSYSLLVSNVSGAVVPDGTRHVYSRDMLLQMNCAGTQVMSKQGPQSFYKWYEEEKEVGEKRRLQ